MLHENKVDAILHALEVQIIPRLSKTLWAMGVVFWRRHFNRRKMVSPEVNGPTPI